MAASKKSKSEIFNRLNDIMALARSKGADDVVLTYGENRSLSTTVRMGALEDVTSNEEAGLRVKVLVGRRAASSGLIMPDNPADLAESLEALVARARVSSEDPYEGLADPSQIIRKAPKMDFHDRGKAPSPRDLIDAALAAESAMFAEDQAVQNSEGASASYSRHRGFLFASNGLAQCETSTSFGLSASAIAVRNGLMETDGDYTSALHRGDLRSAEEVGRRAARRAVEKLDSRKVKTGQYPVIFDPRVSGRLVGAFLNAIHGSSVAKGTTFLLDSLGKKIFADGITIVEDPLMPRGLRSRTHDAQGIPARKLVIVENGVLKTWLLDLKSARQLSEKTPGFGTTGHASGVGNVYMQPGTLSPKDLVRGVDSGFYITELQGAGGNALTGDYSTGASGFWIEKGQKVYAVSEVTIGGKMQDMFLNLTPASDLDWRDRATAVPTLRIDGMTVGGK